MCRDALNSQQAGARSGAPAFLHLHDAVVRRQGKNILAIEDFVLEEGQHMALIGPNGAGKSTFIQLVTREVFPLYRDVPPVVFQGNERSTLAQVKESIGVVSATMQDEIEVGFSAKEIVTGALYGTLGIPWHVTPSEAALAKAQKALSVLNVADLADRKMTTLSTGQARRVLIARAMVNDPQALILDEPTSGLDPQGMFYVRQAMRTLAQAGKTILLVTHYPEDIIPEIERVVMIKDATIFLDGSKENVLTSENMTRLFDVPLQVVKSGAYYTLVSEY